MRTSHRVLELTLFSGLVLAWGLNYLFVRQGLQSSAPLWLAFFRSGLGAAVAAALLGLLGTRGRLDRRGKRDAVLLGIPNTAGFFGLWFVGAGHVLPGTASVIVYTFPLWVAILSGPVLARPLSGVHWAAVATGFGGIVLISRPWVQAGHALPPIPVAELLGGALCWAAGTVLAQRRFSGAALFEANTYQLVGGALVLLVASAILEPTGPVSVNPMLVADVLWLGVVGTAFGYGVWFWLLGRTDASRLSAYVFLVPVVALTASAVIYAERLDLDQWAGVALVLIALYVVAVRRPARSGSRELPARTTPRESPDP